MSLSNTVLLKSVWAVAVTAIMLLSAAIANAELMPVSFARGEFKTVTGEDRWSSFEFTVRPSGQLHSYDYTFYDEPYTVRGSNSYVDPIDAIYWRDWNQMFELQDDDAVITDGVTEWPGAFAMMYTDDQPHFVAWLESNDRQAVHFGLEFQNVESGPYTVPEPSPWLLIGIAALGCLAFGLR